MILIPLPLYSQHTGAACFAAVEPPLGLERDDDVIPSGAHLLEVRCPSARLMANVPDALPGASCFDALGEEARLKNLIAWERWSTLFLSRAISSPRLTPADIERDMGTDGEALTLALLRLWNWIPAEDGSLPNMPGEPFQDILRFLAGKLRRAPSEILDMPFDAFVLNYRVLQTKKKADAAALMDEEHPLSPESIGIEE